ncbi:hypothetical protein N431DRAFT_430902 [Stipitochalara longipes BDJ]|nr:hypothetical protein N431DRAFT_430902 [Stipitochalara longipes BDJ]
MLRRSNSSRLSRKKSTSSVHSKHESIDPAVARQHAHTAATLAFARAQERSSADVGHSGSNLPNNTRIAPDRHPLSQQTSSANVQPVVKRQHSVRFAGPDAIQRRQSIGARALQRPSHDSNSAGLRPIAITTNAAVPAAYRPPSRSSSIGKASISKTTVGNLQAAALYVEYLNEEDAPSTPSSYRRLRRSKSMFSPLKAPSVFYTNGTPDRPENSYMGCQNSVSYLKTPQSQPQRPPLRAPKSMSFLRGGRALFDRNDEAVQMARDRFFQEAAQQRLREQPSFILRSKAQKQEKPFRKSVRSSSGNSYGAPISSGTGPHPSPEFTLKDAARRASKTIKNKLRRVFGRSKEDTVEVPNQQVDARETHVRRYNGDPDAVHKEFSNIPHPDEAAISRVASRLPSLHNANSNQQLRSYSGSVRSVRSSTSGHSDDKSRVTSWNSTGVNTMASQTPRPYMDREQQRLSIINENGTHIPSSSFTRPRLVHQFQGYPPAHRSSKSAGHIPALGSGPVDSARVYSALMKRLDENSPKARIEASHKASMENVNVSSRQPLRSSSVGSSRGNRTPATIRHVLPEDSIGSSQSRGSEQHSHQWVRADSVNSARAEDVFGFTGGHVHQWVPADSLREARMRNPDDVFSPKNDTGNKENVTLEQPTEQRQPDASTISREASTRTSYHTVPETFGLTPQELAFRNEPVVQNTKVLRESRSTFFGGTSVTLARTTSPFRRAMTEAEHHDVVVTDDALLAGHGSTFNNPPYLSPEAAASVDTLQNAALDSEKAYSDSIYSRTTSGQTPAAASSALSLPIGHPEIPEMPILRSNNGDVVIIDRTTYRPVMPGGGSHRVTSSNGSIEWKTWMSSEVAKLERSKENASTSYVNYALPTMPRSFHAGHVREAAQIDDDDVVIAQPKAYMAKQPLGLVQQQNPNIPSAPVLKPILKNRSTISLVENNEIQNIGNPAIPIPPPPPPPIPVRSPLRPMPSKSSLRSVATINTSHTGSVPNSAIKISSLSGRTLLHKRNGSQATLRSAKSASIKSVETPAKLVKRIGRPLNVNTPSPGGALTAENRFGSTSTNSRYRTPGMASSENAKEETDDVYGTEGTGLMGPRMSASDLEAQALGSKKMVELFLSSRRRRIAGGSEESGAAFL